AYSRDLHSFPTRRSSDLAYTIIYHFLLVPFSPMLCVIVAHNHSDENRKHLLLNIPSVSVIKLRILAMDCLLCRQWTLYHLFYLRSEEHTSELQSRFDLVC